MYLYCVEKIFVAHFWDLTDNNIPEDWYLYKVKYLWMFTSGEQISSLGLDCEQNSVHLHFVYEYFLTVNYTGN